VKQTSRTPHIASWHRVLPLLALLAVVGCKKENAYVPPPPPDVGVAKPLQQAFTPYLELTGNTAAYNQVDLDARIEGFLPPWRAEAPAVAGLKAREAELRPGRGQVISHQAGELEELGRHHRAHGVHSHVLGAGLAAAIAEEARHRVHRTGAERFAQHVARVTLSSEGHRHPP